jgi:hypothetical protein
MLDWRKNEVMESPTYEALKRGIPPLTSVIQVRMYVRVVINDVGRLANSTGNNLKSQ